MKYVNTSVKFRFVVTFLTNTLRSFINFSVGLLIARGLGPIDYGNFVFLIGTFLAIQQIMDMGTSSAFYTFISQRRRSLLYILYYIAWQIFQAVIVFIFVAFIFNDKLIELLWVGQTRSIVLLAMSAAFLQNQAWNVYVQIGESWRMTQQVQVMNLLIAFLHMILILAGWWFGVLTLTRLFVFIIAEYLIGILIALLLYNNGNKTVPSEQAERFGWHEMLEEYKSYCIPLVWYGVIGFVSDFLDRWLLQHFNGADEQGYFGVSRQFSVVCLLATTSMIRIFWKEIAEAYEKHDIDRMMRIYYKSCYLLYMFGVILGGLVVPWSQEIIDLVLGSSYVAATIPLAVMFVYPAHQALGQITGTILLAGNQTKIYFKIGLIFVGFNIPVTYLTLASTDALVPGLAAGALGMSIKMVVINILGVNLNAWWVARIYGWPFKWFYQVYALGFTLAAGWLAKSVTLSVVTYYHLPIFFQTATFFVYCILVGGMLLFFPCFDGLGGAEFKVFFSRFAEMARGKK